MVSFRSLIRKSGKAHGVDDVDVPDDAPYHDEIVQPEPVREAEPAPAPAPTALRPASTPPWLAKSGQEAVNGVDPVQSAPAPATVAPQPQSPPSPAQAAPPAPALPRTELRETYDAVRPAPEQPLRTQNVHEALAGPATVSGWDERYVLARNEWDERVSTHVTRERNWRNISFGCMLVTAVAVIGCVVLSGRMTIVPHIVEVDREGTVVATYGSDQLRGTIDNTILRAIITQWITSLRTVTADRMMQSQLLRQAAAFLPSGSQSHSRVATLIRDESPFDRSATVVVHPKVVEIRALTTNSWYVVWDETITPRQGGVKSVKRFTATLVTERGAIDPDRVMWNPLGVFVIEFDFSGSDVN